MSTLIAEGCAAPGPVSDVRVEPCRDPLRLWRVRFRDSAGARWQQICGSRAKARAVAKELRRVGIAERAACGQRHAEPECEECEP